ASTGCAPSEGSADAFRTGRGPEFAPRGARLLAGVPGGAAGADTVCHRPRTGLVGADAGAAGCGSAAVPLERGAAAGAADAGRPAVGAGPIPAAAVGAAAAVAAGRPRRVPGGAGLRSRAVPAAG